MDPTIHVPGPVLPLRSHRLGRLAPTLIVLAALLGVVAVAWPSAVPAHGFWTARPWPWRAMVLIGDAAMLAGVGVALVLARQRFHQPSARPLAAALVLAALAFGLGTDPRLPWTTPARVLPAASAALGFLALAGLIRFAGLFPRRLPAHMLAAALTRHAWAMGAGLGGAAAVAILVDRPALVLLPVALLAPGLLLITSAQRSVFAHGTESERRRMLWLLLGVLLPAAMFAVAAAVFLAAPLLSGGLASPATAAALALAAAYPAIAAGGMVLVACLAIAVFQGHRLNPRPAISATVAYGALAFLLPFAFVVLEKAAAYPMARRLSLPEDAAVWLSAGVVAAAAGVLRRPLAHTARRVVAVEAGDAGPEDAARRSPEA